MRSAIVVLAAALLSPAAAYAQSTTYRFKVGGPNGYGPSPLTPAGKGIYYGTNMEGGSALGGTLYSAKVFAHGWRVTKLHDFGANSSLQEASPNQVAVAPDGSLYGTTAACGSTLCQGVLYHFVPGANAYTVLHQFAGGADGQNPRGAVAIGQNGIVYGVAGQAQSAGGSGVIFAYNPTTSVFATLYQFTFPQSESPDAVTLDAAGTTLVGTTSNAANLGRVYKFDLATNTLATVHKFTGGADGSFDRNGVTFGYTGDAYGTSYPNVVYRLAAAKLNFKVLGEVRSMIGARGRLNFGVRAAKRVLIGVSPTGGANNRGFLFNFDIGTGTAGDFYDLAQGECPNALPQTVYGRPHGIYDTSCNRAAAGGALLEVTAK